MPGRATKAPEAPVDEVKVEDKAGADETSGQTLAPRAEAEPTPAGQDRVMTRAAAQKDLENRLKLQEAQCAAAMASRDLYKSAFNVFSSSLLAAIKGCADIEDLAQGLQAASMEQAVKDSSKVLNIKDLSNCDLTGKELTAMITKVCGLVPKILDSMSAQNVIEVQSLIVPIIKGQESWKKVNYAVSEKCRRDSRGVPGLCDLVNNLCAEADAKDVRQYVKEAAVTVVAVLLSS